MLHLNRGKDDTVWASSGMASKLWGVSVVEEALSLWQTLPPSLLDKPLLSAGTFRRYPPVDCSDHAEICRERESFRYLSQTIKHLTA